MWLQEPETRWDEDIVTRANKAINGHNWVPATPLAPSMAAPATPSAPAAQTVTPPAATVTAGASTAHPATPESTPVPFNTSGQLFDLNELVAYAPR